MRRTDLTGIGLEERRLNIHRLRAMTPEEKLQEVCRLIEEKWARDRVYRASLFPVPMASTAVGRLVRIAPDDPRR